DKQFGAVYNDTGTFLSSVGVEPLLLEPVKATITVKGDAVTSVKVVDVFGVPTDKSVARTGNTFTIDGRYATYYYEIKRASDGEAPAVTGVFADSTSWTQGFRDALDPGQGRGMPIPQGASQLAPLTWHNVDRVRITFSQDVTVEDLALAVQGLSGAYGVGAPSYDAGTMTATWTLAEPIDQPDIVSLTLDDAKVYGSGGALDGEWTDGSSTFPSGNGSAGGDFVFTFAVRPGDVTGDGQTDALDIDATNAENTAGTDGPAYDF
ncbi:unnamed protein product, partial [marine sediment metagenome]